MTNSDLARQHIGLVRKLAYSIVRRLPSHVHVEDLISAGLVGLAEAIDRRDPTQDERFEGYASIRILGSMRDELRALDPLSRDMRDVAKDIRAAVRCLTAELGRTPDDQEVADRLGMTLERFRSYQLTLSVCNGIVPIELEEAVEVRDDKLSPEAALMDQERFQGLAAAARHLPPRLLFVLRLYYEQGRTLEEIGTKLGVTLSRACQMRGEGVSRLRELIAKPKDFAIA